MLVINKVISFDHFCALPGESCYKNSFASIVDFNKDAFFQGALPGENHASLSGGDIAIIDITEEQVRKLSYVAGERAVIYTTLSLELPHHE